MRVAVVGSRSIGTADASYTAEEARISIQKDQDEINYHLDKLLLPCGGEDGDEVTIISGGAKGVDTLAQEWARINKKDFILFKPYHLIDSSVAYHPRYFFTRNKQIIDNSDVVIIFWDGKSKGTLDAIKKARKQGKDLRVITLETNVQSTDIGGT